ncbi:chorismate mutase [Variovorax sp. UC122_21]|uniref:chorismate mutase n=1 Tax=Variovorax TaxID=34072 RepID=UPI001934B000|nr:chorismate mutase [Variovorax paradoxus]
MQSPSSFYALDDQAPGASSDQALVTLQALHVQLDGVDERLLQALRQRLDCCWRIGLHKRKHGMSLLEPRRMDFVQRKAVRFGADHGIRGGFMQALYSLIIDEACRLELEAMKTPCDSGLS